MPTKQQNQGEGAAVRSAPNQQRRNVVTRVLSACVRMWAPNPAVPLRPSTPALDGVDQLPGPSSGPTESSSSPPRRGDKKQDQVAAESLQQEARRILTQPPPTFSTQGTGRTSLLREQPVENSAIRKTAIIASEFSCSPTEQGTAAPDQLVFREGSSKVDEESGKAGAGSASETDGNHHKRFASPACGKISAPDDTAGVTADVATENPHCATAENALETCQKCRPIWMSPDELDAMASIDESGGVPTRMEAKVHHEVPQRPSSPRVPIEPASRFSSAGGSKSAATQKPEAATKEEVLPKKIPREHAVPASQEIVTRENGTTLAEKAMTTGIEAKNPDEARDLVLRISKVFAESAACRPRTEGDKGEDTMAFLSRMVDVFADETNQAHGPVWDASSRLLDGLSLPAQRPASSKLGESDAIAEAAAATAATASAVMETYDPAFPRSRKKPGDEIDKNTRKPFDMGRVEQTRPRSKQGEARALGASEKLRTATAPAASRAPTCRAWPGPLKQHSPKRRTELEGKHFSGVPQEQKPGAKKASAPSSGTVVDGRHSTAGPAAAAAPSGTPAAPRLVTFGSFPSPVALATMPVPAGFSISTAAASSAKAQHQPDVASTRQSAATASSSSSESSGGWKWPTDAASADGPSERNLGGKAVGGAAVSAIKADKPRFESFKWMGRASTPKAKLPWGSWKRKRDSEAWEKMVSGAILK